jgi:hypothetical protein
VPSPIFQLESIARFCEHIMSFDGELAMAISLNPRTQKLIEERMKASGYSSPDELLEVALQTLDQVQGEDYDQLDPSTRAAIEEAEAQYQRGEGIPLDEAFARLRKKHVD